MVTAQDFKNFADFALPLIGRGEAESIAELLQRWEMKRADEESIKKGIGEMEAGLGVPLDDALAEIRRNIGIEE